MHPAPVWIEIELQKPLPVKASLESLFFVHCTQPFQEFRTNNFPSVQGFLSFDQLEAGSPRLQLQPGETMMGRWAHATKIQSGLGNTRC